MSIRTLLKPKYLIGRFKMVRQASAFSLNTLQKINRSSLQSIRICDKYENNYKVLNVRNSFANVVNTQKSAKEHVESLKQTAYSDGIKLTLETQKKLVELAMNKALLASNKSRFSYLAELQETRKMKSEIALAKVISSSDFDSVQKIATDPILLEVVTQHLGYFPGRVSSWLFWSFVNNMSDLVREKSQTIRFHYDVDGLNFIYVNFYLLDTDADSGAHVLIPGSHNNKKLWQLFGSARLTDKQALECYGKNSLKVITGLAGSGFFEDTSCYHKALPPLKRDRLMLQLRYA